MGTIWTPVMGGSYSELSRQQQDNIARNNAVIDSDRAAFERDRGFQYAANQRALARQDAERALGIELQERDRKIAEGLRQERIAAEHADKVENRRQYEWGKKLSLDERDAANKNIEQLVKIADSYVSFGKPVPKEISTKIPKEQLGVLELKQKEVLADDEANTFIEQVEKAGKIWDEKDFKHLDKDKAKHLIGMAQKTASEAWRLYDADVAHSKYFNSVFRKRMNNELESLQKAPDYDASKVDAEQIKFNALRDTAKEVGVPKKFFVLTDNGLEATQPPIWERPKAATDDVRSQALKAIEAVGQNPAKKQAIIVRYKKITGKDLL